MIVIYQDNHDRYLSERLQQAPSIKKNPPDTISLSFLFLPEILPNSFLSTPFLLAKRANLTVGGSYRSHHHHSGWDFILQVTGGDLIFLDFSSIRRQPNSAPTATNLKFGLWIINPTPLLPLTLSSKLILRRLGGGDSHVMKIKWATAWAERAS